jgi:hypothetical protein
MLAEIGFIGRTATPVFLTVGQVVSVSSQRKCWGLHLPVTPFIRPYPVQVGDYFRLARHSGRIANVQEIDTWLWAFLL